VSCWISSVRLFLSSALQSKELTSPLHSKLDAKIAETTWVHKLFGGRLRSRVTCRDCGHNSDTFDRILDLSLDILRCDSLKEALRNFVNVEVLKGADKYKCEKCVFTITGIACKDVHKFDPLLIDAKGMLLQRNVSRFTKPL